MALSLSLFIPATADPHPEYEGISSDLDRLKYILLPSIRKFMDRDLYYRIFVLTPDRDMEIARVALADFEDLKIEILRDSEVLADDMELAPWCKQQILKLKIFELIPTDLYFILDADMVATRPITRSDFFAMSRPRAGFNWATHPQWWTQSAKTLGYSYDILANRRLPAFTPQIFYKSVVRKLAKKIERLYPGAPWYATLARLFCFGDPIRWTEYCIYWLYLYDSKHFDHFYDTDVTFEFVGYCIWNEQDFRAADEAHYRRMFDPSYPHCFSIIQSTVQQADAKTVYEKIGQFIE